MHHLTCGISSLLHSVNLILFTVLVHLILRISPRHSHHLCSHHLSLPLPFTADLKLISFTNTFLHGHSYSFRTAFMDLSLSFRLWVPGVSHTGLLLHSARFSASSTLSCRSFMLCLTTSIHLFLCFPLLRCPPTFASKIRLTQSSSSRRCTCPYHLSRSKNIAIWT